jgi:hypothetical protein
MANRDYSEYEKRRAEDHEDAWRFAATLVNISDRHCHYRVCRRYQICQGPMLPSDHQRGVVHAQKEIGLSGTACASLPMCMANASAEHYDYVRRVCQKLKDMRSRDFEESTALEFLYLVRESARRQAPGRFAPLTSPARQPTSEPEEKG